MKINTMQDLYIDLLRDMYSAEMQLIKALPKVAEKANSTDLKEAVTSHLEETKEQAERLVRIFEMHDEKPGGETCEVMKGWLDEADELMNSGMKGDVLDAALIAAGEKIEHYEVASYLTLSAFASHLDLEDQEELLNETLEEEMNAADTLMSIFEQQWISNSKAQPQYGDGHRRAHEYEEGDVVER